MSSESRKRRYSREAIHDPNMVWQTYKSCKQRGEESLANDALFKYTEMWSKSSTFNSQAVRYRLDPHLLPSLAFEETSGEWLLQTRPPGILSCLEELVAHLGTQLTNEGSRKLFGRGGESKEDTNKPIIQLPLLMKVLLKIICCSENLVAVSQTKLAQTATDICSNCLRVILSRNFDTESSISELLKTMGYCGAIIHILSDPQRNWLKGMSQNTLISNNSVMNPVTITRDIVKIINDTYTSLEELLQGRCDTEYKSLQLEMLHLVGAMLSGSQPNAEIVVLSISETLPFTILEPREECTPLQVTGIRVLIRMVHVLHCLVPEELLSNIDVRVLLSGLFNVLSPRWNNNELIPPHPELVISILDSFAILCEPPHDAEGLKELLINVAVMEKVCEVLNTLKEICDKSQELGLRLCCSIIRAYGCVMYQNIPAQEAFEQRVGYRRFRKQLSTVITPVKEILLELLNLVIEDDFTQPSKETITIHNTSIVCMLLRWLPSLTPSLRKWLIQNLFDLSTTAVHNRQKCCVAGVLRVIVEVLAKSQNEKKYVGKQVEDKLIELVEILGSHSVVAAELKQIIGSLRTTEDGKLPSYYYRLQQALCTMASNKEGTTPLYYFDLRQPGSHIAIPELRSLPSSNGFTFHVWVCLNVPSSLGRPIQGGGEQFTDDRRKCRRMLYSFHSRNGMGFEAFFTENMNLVVATATKKEFHTFTIQKKTFRSAEWHKITIVNNLGRKWGKNEITVYIDGDNAGTAQTKAPSDKRYVYTYIGAHHSAYRRRSQGPSTGSIVSTSELQQSSNSFVYDQNVSDDEADGPNTSLPSGPQFKVATISSRDVEVEWGHPEHLTGLISTVCIFTDRLAPNYVQILHNHPHNDLSLFQPKCDATQELASKVQVYFHPKSCKDSNCVNLLAQTTGPRYNGILSGEPYVTWDVKDVLNSLGGMELLFPILENVCIPPKQFTVENPRAQPMDNDHYYHEDDGKKEIFNEHQGAAAFVHLLIAMLDGSFTNQEVFFLRQGPATVGALLQKVSPCLLTQQFLSAIQRLTEIFRRHHNKSYVYDIQKYLLFNFRIWSRPSVDVRKEHIEYLMTIIRDEQEHCRVEFGVEFMLDVLRIHYSKMGCTSNFHNVPDHTPINDEDAMSIRGALINSMKLYVMNDVRKDEVTVILQFLTACQDTLLLDEILRFLLNLLNTCSCSDALSRYLWNEGSPLIVFVQAENTNIRLLAIKVLSLLIKKHNDTNTGPIYLSLQNGALAAAVRHMAVYDIPSSVLLALLELCTAKGSDLTEYISSFPLYMAVLQLLRSVKLVVRHTVCHQFISLLQLNPGHIDSIVTYPAWESLFLWLLCKQDSNSDAIDVGESDNVGVANSVGVADNKVEKQQLDKSSTDEDTDCDNARRNPPPSSPATNQITHYSYSHWYQYFSEDDDIYRTFAVVTETLGYILWHQINQEGGLWLTWGHLLAALDEFTGSHPLIVPDFIVKQRLFSLLMNAVSLECRRAGVNQSALFNTILQLSQLLETFVMASYPSCINSNNVTEIEQSNDIIRGVSHSITLELDMQSCCIELLNQYLDMLNSANLLAHDPSMSQDSVKLSILQSALRILLAAIASNDQQHYTLAAARLLSIVHTGALEKQDVLFFLKHVLKPLEHCMDSDCKSDHTHHLIATIREIFVQHHNMMDLRKHLPHLPDPVKGHTFSPNFIEYVEQGEWIHYTTETLVHEASNYNIVLFPWLTMCLKRRQDCITTFQNNEARRREKIYIEQDSFQDTILSPFTEHRDEEVKRQKTRDSLCQTDYSATLRQWKAIKKFFTGERGAWSNRVPDPYLWGLSRTENFSRMRMKTTRLYTADNHSEAARLRDLAEGGTVDKLKQEDRSLLQKAARTSSLHDDEEDEDLEQNRDQRQLQQEGNDPIPNREGEEEDADVKEETVRTEKCEVIVLMEKVSGRLEVSNKHIYFFVEQSHQDKKDLLQWYNPEFKIKLNDLREIHSRRYNMARTALELFLVDQTNFFINFQTRKIVRRVYESIIQQKTPNLNRVGIRKPSKLLQTAGLTEKWRRREISNFDYLLQLNTVAGRTYNDLNQYPIFPWVLKDFTSDELNLDDPSVYRNFSLPMGAQNSSKREELEMKYNEVDDPVLGRFHHGSHYSNAAGVLHYLIRLEPFTTLHIDLQDGRFDVADRQFISIPTTAANVFKGSSSDVKELIPEFFYLPDFLTNVNLFDLGVRRHTEEKIDDVILPPWAKSPEDFIQKHKDALESQYVSDHLHEWIDLIFGYKQSGQDGVKAYNIFLKYSYEENVNLEDMKDETEKRRIEAIINNFGQTPTKLFNEPHVKRWSLEQCKKNPSKGIFVGTRKSHVNLFEKLESLKAYGVDIIIGEPNDGGVVFVGTPTIQTRAVLVSGNPEPLVTITGSGLLNVHGWLPFSNARKRPFSFQFDPNSHFDKSRQYIGAPFAQDIVVNHHLFVLSPNNKLLITGGHWDNSFRVVQIDRGKLTKRINLHNDIVTCMALDKSGTGEHLVTGSRDTTCVIWKLKQDSVSDQPLVTLYGHDHEVLCVDISTELDIVASGDKDGTCIVHTVRGGSYVYTIKPRPKYPCEIRHIAISNQGRILIYSQGPDGKNRSMVVPPCIHLYSINGKQLFEKELAEPLNDLVVVGPMVITGNDKGFLTFRELSSLRQLNSLNLLESIRCISVVLHHQSKICTHLLVGLKNGKLIIVTSDL